MRRVLAETIQAETEAVDVKLPEAHPSANCLGWFEDRTANFYNQLMSGDLNRASAELSEMKILFGKTDSELIHVRFQVLEGTLAYYQDRIKDSESMLSSACPKLEALGLRSELWQTLPIMGWCWRRLRFPDDLIQSLNDNAQNVLESITSEMAPQDQARFLLNKGTADELYIDSQIDRLLLMRAEFERTPFYLRPVRKWKLMSHVNDLLVHIENYKNKLANPVSDGQRSDDRTKPYSLWRRLVSHERRRASIYFLVLPTRVIWIRNSWLRLDFDVVRVKRVNLRDLVQKWHLLVAHINEWRRSATGSVDQQDSPLKQLLRNLIPIIDEQTSADLVKECSSTVEQIAEALQIPAILEGLSKHVRSLVFHPDDVLHGFPFAAIQSDGRYLIERFAVSEGLDGSKQNTTAHSAGRKALLVGVSSGTSYIPALPGKAVGRLPGAKSEVEKIEQWLVENNFHVRVLSEKEASKSTLLEALPAASLVHIACHGVFTPNRPDKTGLVLIPESGVGEILTIKELSELNLVSIEHATLSSCSSADNFVLPGRWVLSFPEVLRRAGVRSVLANLWEVDDRVAVAFMKRFYEYLNDHPRDEAIRRTQLDCLGTHSMDYAQRQLDDVEGITVREPFYWAGYILCVDYRQLSLM
jgi:CHAT domain-containing protein